MGYVCKACSEDMRNEYKGDMCPTHRLLTHFSLYMPDPSPPTDAEVDEALEKAQRNLVSQQEQLTRLEQVQLLHLKNYEDAKKEIFKLLDTLEIWRIDGEEKLKAVHKNQKEEISIATSLIDQLHRVKKDPDARRPFLKSHRAQIDSPPVRITETFATFSHQCYSVELPKMRLSDDRGCPHVFVRGTSKGKVCGKESTFGCEGYCTPHFGSILEIRRLKNRVMFRDQ